MSEQNTIVGYTTTDSLDDATRHSHTLATKMQDTQIDTVTVAASDEAITTYSLNGTGHTTYIWKKSDAASVIPAIQQAMDAGHTFFVITPQAGGALPPTQAPLAKAIEAKKTGAISGTDNHFADLVARGVVTAHVTTPDSEQPTVKRAETAAEAAGTNTVSVKRAVGG